MSARVRGGVMGHLLLHTRDDGYAYLSVPQLAELIPCTKRTVYVELAELRDAGLIGDSEHLGKGHYRRWVNTASFDDVSDVQAVLYPVVGVGAA